MPSPTPHPTTPPFPLPRRAVNGAQFDLTSNKLRPISFTSGDAAGLAIFPGLIKHDETVIAKEIKHAIRVTFYQTRPGYDPMTGATHQASRSSECFAALALGPGGRRSKRQSGRCGGARRFKPRE